MGNRFQFTLPTKKYILILFITLLPYLPVATFGFVFDDFRVVVSNETIQTIQIKNIWYANPHRFLTNLLFAIQYRLWGLNPIGYHLVNLFFHILSVFLVFQFVSLIARNTSLKNRLSHESQKNLPVFSTLLFALHPIQTQAVTYISQLPTVMTASFYLGSIVSFLYFLHKRNNRIMWIILSFIFSLFAYFTKEHAFSLPVTILFVLILFHTIRTRTVVIIFGLYVAIALISYSFMRASFIQKNFTNVYHAIQVFGYSPPQSVSSRMYVLTQFTVIPKYIGLILLPIDQNADHDVPVYSTVNNQILYYGFIIAGFIITALFLLRKNPLISFGILYFFATISLESSIFPIADFMQEHRLYLPSIGLFILVSYLIISLISLGKPFKNRVLPVFVLILVSTLGVLTFQRNLIWQNELTFWQDVIQKSPNKVRGHYNLGLVYFTSSNLDSARKEFEYVYNLDPDFWPAEYMLVHIYVTLGESKYAANMFEAVMTRQEENTYLKLAQSELMRMYGEKRN